MTSARNIIGAAILALFALGWSLVPAVHAQTLPDGTLVRAKDESRVYLIAKSRKYWIRSPAVLQSYRLLWDSVREVSPGALAVYPDIELIAREGDTRVYYVKGDVKRWISSPEAFAENGFKWNTIFTVNETDFGSYATGGNITGDISGATVTVEVTPVVPASMPPGADFSLLWNTWYSIIDRYKDNTTLNTQRMVEGAVEGLVKSLGDPYTTFLKPADARKFAEDVAGEFFGIGAELGYRDGVVIIAPLKGLPAERAGLRAGDKIIRIDDESAMDMTAEDAVLRIRGEKGVPVTLTIEREGQTNALSVTIVRDLIEVPIIEWEKKTNDIFYVKLYNFFGNVESVFLGVIAQAKADGMQKLILDLRNNPGGLLDDSINIAAQFIEPGELIVTADFGKGKDKQEFISPGGGILENVPTVVLINRGSASASEIVAGALKDSRGITLIGERTFGKGTIQEMVQFAGGASLKITSAQWVRPSGKPIDESGIAPDVEVGLTDEDRIAGRDPQLEKAFEILKKLGL